MIKLSIVYLSICIISILDYSVAKQGKLVAYRWDGEQILDKNKFCFN